jgi:two-component system cell cycle sensor histidine kinase/response regulator CckA
MSQIVVLLAEHEPAVRQLIALTLQQENLIVLPACDAAEALEIFRTHGNIDLLLTGVYLGEGVSGFELAERILDAKPGSKVLVISGFPGSEVLAAENGLPYLGKPFLPSELIQRVRQVLATRIPVKSTKPKRQRMTG